MSVTPFLPRILSLKGGGGGYPPYGQNPQSIFTNFYFLVLHFWISGFLDSLLGFWRLLGNKESYQYRRSHGLKTTGSFRTFQKDTVKRPKGPLTRSRGPPGLDFSYQYFQMNLITWYLTFPLTQHWFYL